MEGSLYTADLLMQKDRQEKLERNTKVLDSVIDTIYTLGSQNMPLTLFQRGRGGGFHPPPGFSLAIATKINRSTPNFLTFNFYYLDIIGPKIKFITCQGVT